MELFGGQLRFAVVVKQNGKLVGLVPEIELEDEVRLALIKNYDLIFKDKDTTEVKSGHLDIIHETEDILDIKLEIDDIIVTVEIDKAATLLNIANRPLDF